MLGSCSFGMQITRMKDELGLHLFPPKVCQIGIFIIPAQVVGYIGMTSNIVETCLTESQMSKGPSFSPLASEHMYSKHCCETEART